MGNNSKQWEALGNPPGSEFIPCDKATDLWCPAQRVGPQHPVAVWDAGQAVEVVLEDQVPHGEP